MMRSQRPTFILNCSYSRLDSLSFTIKQKRPEPTGHAVERQKPQIKIVELKRQRVLLLDLVDCIQKLQECRRKATRLRVCVQITPTVNLVSTQK